MRDLLDAEGENQAVRTFLMQYSCDCSITVGAMRSHMTRSGWGEEAIPQFARNTYSAEHLTKSGAQIWIRHLFSLEGDVQRQRDEAFALLRTMLDDEDSGVEFWPSARKLVVRIRALIGDAP